jgi:hypothetical protein
VLGWRSKKQEKTEKQNGGEAEKQRSREKKKSKKAEKQKRKEAGKQKSRKHPTWKKMIPKKNNPPI